MADDTQQHPYPQHGPVLGVDALKTLAHPLRISILDELSKFGPLTASGLGERLGESSGSTSYHLRQLEKHGLVREVAGKGNARERWWERRPGSISTPEAREFAPGSPERLATRLIEEEWNRGRESTFREFASQGEEIFDEEWLRVAAVDTINLRLTSDQLQQLVNELDAVLFDYIGRYKKTPSPGSRPVQIQLSAFPLVRGDVTPGDVGGREKNS